MNKRKVKKRYLVLAAVVVVLVLLLALVEFFTDLLWFKELGYISVFLKQLVTQLEFGIPAFILITFICRLYLRRFKLKYYRNVGACDLSIPEKRINLVTNVLSGVFGLFSAILIADRLWYQILEFINSTDFGITDPVFGRDVSFYVFKLDFLTRCNNLLIYIVLGFAVVNVLYYAVMLSMRRPSFMSNEASGTSYDNFEKEKAEEEEAEPQDMAGKFFYYARKMNERNQRRMEYAQKDKAQNSGPVNRDNASRLFAMASRELKILGVIFFLMLALHFFLKQFTLLYTDSVGVVYGAGYADINVTLWVYRLLIALSLIGVYTFLRGFNKRSWKMVLSVPVLLIVLQIAGGLATAGVQSLIVSPDELSKERQYLENNIQFTRYAYDLQDIVIEDYDVQYNLSVQDLLDNSETISNIRINDYQPALKFYNQTQSIRLYYHFNDVDVDRYFINGEYTQTFLAAREIDESTINDTWMSRHLKYTHGYGITLSRVDSVTESGQPALLVDSIPPVSSAEEIVIERPEIYFGESTEGYVIVNTDEPEFDYPADTGNVYCEYEGNAGIRLNLLNRILFAIREDSMKILVSSNINKDSRIIINRQIEDRVKKIAPFLAFDSDPYMVVADGRLYWMFDAYTTSRYYPYSEPFDSTGINYIRNSVKVVVDAYNGDTLFYVVDEDDPLAATLQKIYPDLFHNLDDMPESLQAHIRYPNTMFSIQANVYAKYHMENVDAFYQNEDGWAIATETYGVTQIVMTPTYYIMKLPGETEAEFINSIPYTPSGKNNMTALLVARNDGEHYGELVLYQFPRDRLIYGPQQIEAQIDQDPEIAQDFTLWSSSGSNYTRGNLFVIPIAGSLMYVEPVYLESATSSIPEVKKVIIYYNEKIAYADTLALCLEKMFGNGASAAITGGAAGGVIPDTPDDDTGVDSENWTQQELANKAMEAFNQATQAQQNGDWSAYGEYLQQLQNYLEQLNAAFGSTNTSGLTDMSGLSDDALTLNGESDSTVDTDTVPQQQEIVLQ